MNCLIKNISYIFFIIFIFIFFIIFAFPLNEFTNNISDKSCYIYTTYDEIDDEKSVDGVVYESKELYVKKVPEFLKAIPPKCTALELIRALYEASPEDNRAFLLGVAKPGGVVEMFDGRQSDKTVELTDRDKLIMYCNH